MPALLGAGSASCFTERLQAATELIRSFVGEAQVRCLIVQKLVMKEEEEGEEKVSFVVLSEVREREREPQVPVSESDSTMSPSFISYKGR